MNHPILCVSLGIICIIAVAFTGCIGSGPGNHKEQTMPPALSETAVQAGNLVVTEEQNNAMVFMNKSSIITVKLGENPTTGYQWVLTTTPGLNIMNDAYVPTYTTGKLVRAGGTHSWNISTGATGEQKIQAVYTRSREQTSGNEITFSMTVVVT